MEDTKDLSDPAKKGLGKFVFIAVVAGDDTAFYAHEETHHPDSARPIIFRDWKDQTWKGTVITLLAIMCHRQNHKNIKTEYVYIDFASIFVLT